MLKAFVTSVGEKTTQVCCEQLKRFGFKVILLDKKESWQGKYKRFIKMANEDCIRIDADVIPNRHIKEIEVDKIAGTFGMITYMTYDFYRNDVGITSPVFYSKEVLHIIRRNIDKIPELRPEASASRLSEVNPKKHNSNLIVGIHGFLQDIETMKRAKKNKIDRGQTKEYDFDLAFNLIKI